MPIWRPLEADVSSHKQLLDVVSHTPVEVARLERLGASAGFIDAVRRFIPPDQRLYSWWNYRARDWTTSDRGRLNLGPGDFAATSAGEIPLRPNLLR